ncbi:MAG: hypothetical protein DWQ37_23290 [Planctomycetota bacterium]|nr:MAG: hypothetical protein DWQ37_23290 [Planctomycetota bacterium]
MIALQAPAPKTVAEAPAAAQPAASELEATSTPTADPQPEAAATPAAEPGPPDEPQPPQNQLAAGPTTSPTPREAEPAAESTRPVTPSPSSDQPAPAPQGTVGEAPAPSGPSLKLEPVPVSGNLTSGVVQGDAGASTPSSSTESTPPDDVSIPDPPAPGDSAPTDADTPATPTPLPETEIRARLGVRVAAVEFDNVPIAQFAGFIGDLTGVPVVLDEEALRRAGKHRRTPVSVKLEPATAGAALAAAIKSAGLAVTFADGQIVITAR